MGGFALITMNYWPSMISGLTQKRKANGKELSLQCAMQNVVLISIPSVRDADLAPAGKHTLHAYLPATEPFDLWAGKLHCNKVACLKGIRLSADTAVAVFCSLRSLVTL